VFSPGGGALSAAGRKFGSVSYTEAVDFNCIHELFRPRRRPQESTVAVRRQPKITHSSIALKRPARTALHKVVTPRECRSIIAGNGVLHWNRDSYRPVGSASSHKVVRRRVNMDRPPAYSRSINESQIIVEAGRSQLPLCELAKPNSFREKD